MSDTFSVKFQEGSVADRHEVGQNPKETASLGDSQILGGKIWPENPFDSASTLGGNVLVPDDVDFIRVQGSIYALRNTDGTDNTPSGLVENIQLVSIPYTIRIDGVDCYLLNSLSYKKDGATRFRDFFASGDSVADDTAACQSAVNFNNIGGYSSKIIDGEGLNYNISNSISVSNSRPNAFATVITNATFTASTSAWPGTGTYMFNVAANNVKFDGVVFVNGGVSSSIIVSVATLGFNVNSCRFLKPALFGVNISVGGGHDATIGNSYFDNNDRSNQVATGILCNSADIMVYGCTFRWMSTSAIFNFGGVQFLGNHCYQGFVDIDNDDDHQTLPMTAGVIIRDGSTICNNNYIDTCSIVVRPISASRGIRDLQICNNDFLTNMDIGNTPDQFVALDSNLSDAPLSDLVIKDNTARNVAYGLSTNLRFMSNISSGTFIPSRIICYDNTVASDIKNVSTRAIKTFTIPSGSSQSQQRISESNFPFGEFRYLSKDIPNNPNGYILTSSVVSYSQGTFLFKVDQTVTQDTEVCAKIISNIEPFTL